MTWYVLVTRPFTCPCMSAKCWQQSLQPVALNKVLCFITSPNPCFMNRFPSPCVHWTIVAPAVLPVPVTELCRPAPLHFDVWSLVTIQIMNAEPHVVPGEAHSGSGWTLSWFKTSWKMTWFQLGLGCTSWAYWRMYAFASVVQTACIIFFFLLGVFDS